MDARGMDKMLITGVPGVLEILGVLRILGILGILGPSTSLGMTLFERRRERV